MKAPAKLQPDTAPKGVSDFICSKASARQFLTRLIHNTEAPTDPTKAFYLFSGEKRRVRVTILPSPSGARP